MATPQPHRTPEDGTTMAGLWRRMAIVTAGVGVLGFAGYAAVVSGSTGPGGPVGTPLVAREDPGASWPVAAAVFTGPPEQPAGSEGRPISDVLAGPLAADGLGGRVGTVVVDLATGEQVFADGAEVPQMPASTTKLLTATAALAGLGPDHTFTTAVTTGAALADGVTITLVGGGDPMLGTGEGAAVTPLADLATATAAALEQAGVTQVGLAYDESLFSGPAVDPDWSPSYVPEGIVSPTSALMIDGGRLDPDAGGDSGARADDPAATTAEAFAGVLSEAGVQVTGDPVPAAAAAAQDTVVADISSKPLTRIVEHMLDTSDDDVAETLLRHVAIAGALPATSADGSAAVLATLADLGIDVSTVTLADGSGLSRGNEIPAAVLGAVLATASSPDHPELRAVVTGLPVAGFTGTMTERLIDETGAGVVRAKTGTLTGTSALAGVVETIDGAATLAFAIIADDVTDTVVARSALDEVAEALSTCGCTVP
jgi:serine-type D-Ala-D-Ala carboxypeptidase/endopeptidase (penicillin-binding protein 4)